MVNPRIDGNNVFIENCSDEKIKLTNCDELGNVIKSQFDLYDSKNLIFRNCPNLKKITADCLNLTSLQIENCPNLEKLSAYYNKIKEIDLTGLKNLSIVNLDNGILKNISLTGCKNLQELYVSNNKLEGLDLTDNDRLRILYCSYNNSIKKLALTHLENLETLHCENCCLHILDCRNLKKLKFLYCFDNVSVSRLSLLMLKNCEALEELDCAENQLKKLVLENHPKLKIVSCKTNRIENLIIKNCPELNRINFADQGFLKWDDSKNMMVLQGLVANQFFIDKISSINLETILFAEEADFFMEKESEFIPITYEDFPNLKDFGLCTENDPSFEEWIDKKKQQEFEQQNFNNPYPTPPTTPPSENEGAAIDAANFKIPANKDDLEYFNILAGMRIKGKLVIDGWANLVMLNVGNNLLEHLVVKDCPNLRSVIYSHNKLKRVEIINCPNLSQEYSYSSDNWDAPELTEEEEIQLEQKKEEVKIRQEANDKVYLILQREEQGENIDLDELHQLLNKVDLNLVNPEYCKKFLVLYNKKLKEKFPQLFKKKPKENENKPDFEKLYNELLEKIEKGEITKEGAKDLIRKSSFSGVNSSSDEEKRRTLTKMIDNYFANKEASSPQPTTISPLRISLGAVAIILVLTGYFLTMLRNKNKKNYW